MAIRVDGGDRVRIVRITIVTIFLATAAARGEEAFRCTARAILDTRRRATNLEYDLTILDTVTGRFWAHHNPAGRLESFSDTNAF